MFGNYNTKNELVVNEYNTKLILDLKFEDMVAYNKTTLEPITNYIFDINNVDVNYYDIAFKN